MWWCSPQTNEHDLQAMMYPIICKYHRLNINNGNKAPVFPGYICNRWQNMIVQPSQTHNHGKNMTTMGKVDTSDLMMIIRWVTNIFFHLNSNGPVQHMQPYICKKVIERTNPILDTLTTWYTRQAFFVLNTYKLSCVMMIMGGGSMPKADYDLMAIMYSAYGIHHILCNIDGNRFQPTRHPIQ